LYQVNNNILIKAGPLASIYNSEWCTDKVRHYIDCLYFRRSYIPLVIRKRLCALKYGSSVCSKLSWNCISNYFNMYVLLISLSLYVNYFNLSNYTIYDLYSNVEDLYIFINYTKSLGFRELCITTTSECVFLWLYVGSFKYIDILVHLNISVLIFISLLNYSFPYMSMLIGSYTIRVCLVGVFYNCYSGSYHIGLGISSLCKFFLSLFSVLLINKFVVYLSLYIVSFSTAHNINYLLSGYLLCRSFGIYYNVLLSLTILNVYKFKVVKLFTIVYCALLLNSYSIMCHNMVILFNYVTNLVFRFDQNEGSSFTLHAFDSEINSIWHMNSRIIVSYTAYISYKNIICDVVVPIVLYIELISTTINYYGVISIYNAVINSAGLFKYYDFLMCCAYMKSTELIAYMGYMTPLYIKNMFNRSILSLYELYYVALNGGLESIIVIYFYYVLFKVGCSFIFTSSTFLGVYKLTYYTYPSVIASSYFSYYVDNITYYLTGSMCKVSNFLSRYNTCTIVNSYNFI